jgi:hypothetical protein
MHILEARPIPRSPTQTAESTICSAELKKDIHDFRDRAVGLRDTTCARDALRFAYRMLELKVPDTFLGRSRFVPEEQKSFPPPA